MVTTISAAAVAVAVAEVMFVGSGTYKCCCSPARLTVLARSVVVVVLVVVVVVVAAPVRPKEPCQRRPEVS